MIQRIDLDELELASIVAWQPNGPCFLVHDQKRFEEPILPRFFEMTMYSSLRRELNL